MDGEVSVGLTARLSRENDNIDSARLTRRDATRKRNGVVERCSQDLSGSKNASYGQSSVDEGKRAVGHVGCMRGARSPEWRRSSAPDQDLRSKASHPDCNGCPCVTELGHPLTSHIAGGDFAKRQQFPSSPSLHSTEPASMDDGSSSDESGSPTSPRQRRMSKLSQLDSDEIRERSDSILEKIAFAARADVLMQWTISIAKQEAFLREHQNEKSLRHEADSGSAVGIPARRASDSPPRTSRRPLSTGCRRVSDPCSTSQPIATSPAPNHVVTRRSQGALRPASAPGPPGAQFRPSPIQAPRTDVRRRTSGEALSSRVSPAVATHSVEKARHRKSDNSVQPTPILRSAAVQPSKSKHVPRPQSSHTQVKGPPRSGQAARRRSDQERAHGTRDRPGETNKYFKRNTAPPVILPSKGPPAKTGLPTPAGSHSAMSRRRYTSSLAQESSLTQDSLIISITSPKKSWNGQSSHVPPRKKLAEVVVPYPTKSKNKDPPKVKKKGVQSVPKHSELL
eukprot:m.345783 g.345783  ORF g.345783 m.345783 type:complete len:509 (+) comp16561_c0_seq6:939-2465(+)